MACLSGCTWSGSAVPGSPFVLEADECRGAFLEYAGRFAQLVITNIDFDHPDYPSQDAVEKAFSDLLAHTPPEPARLAARLRAALRSQGADVLAASGPADVVAAVAELASAGEPAVIGTAGAGDVWKTVTGPLTARLG